MPASCSTSPAASALGRVLERRHRRGLSPATGALGRDAGGVARPSGGVRVPLRTQHAKHAQADAAGGPRGFATPSRQGRALLGDAARARLRAAARLRGPPAAPGVAGRSGTARFPLVLTCAKPTPCSARASTAALASLRKRAMSPEVEMHPEAARDRRISPGDWVSITTPHGQRARLRPLQRELSILASWLASTAGGRVVPSSMRQAMTLSARSAPTTIC